MPSRPPSRSPEETHRRTGFSLVELLVVVSLVAVLSSLAMLSMKGISGGARLSTAGAKVAGLFDNARQTAILRQQPTAVVLLTSGETAANRVFTVLGYAPPATPGGTGQWKQISRWETLPEGIVADTGSDSGGNPLKALMPDGSVAVNPALPSLTYRGQSYAAASQYGYVIFMPDGGLYQDAAGSLPSPCVLRLVEGIRRDGQTVHTGSGNANYFEIALIQATGKAKIIRP